MNKHEIRTLLRALLLGPLFLFCAFSPRTTSHSGSGRSYTETINGVSFKMVVVEGGSFVMGEAIEQPGTDNVPDLHGQAPHKVTIQDYCIAETEVTQELWQAVMGSNHSKFSGCLECAMTDISWVDAQAFIFKLNSLTGKKYRLPTEAEWEYAARGGGQSENHPYSGGHDLHQVGWCFDERETTPRPVKTRKANELGLYDMSGNVREWCSDWFADYSDKEQKDPQGPLTGTERVLRGGCFACLVDRSLVYARDQARPDFRFEDFGFRLAAPVGPSPANTTTEPSIAHIPSISDNPSWPSPSDSSFSETVKGLSFSMIAIQGGTFSMGREYVRGQGFQTTPIHTVTLSDFKMGETEVTQALWRTVMGNNPSMFAGCDNCPVENVSWEDAQAFIRKLNGLTQKNYRLPTEAEWEYAARGGRLSKHYLYSGSDNGPEVTWYWDNSSRKTQPVKSKPANELGLYDMSGNVKEWCSDWLLFYHSAYQQNPQGPDNGSERVARGGAWLSHYDDCQVFFREGLAPADQYYSCGFRLAISDK